MFNFYLKFCGTIYNHYQVRDSDVAVHFTLLISSLAIFFNVVTILDFIHYFTKFSLNLDKKSLFLLFFGIVLINYLLIFHHGKQKGLAISKGFNFGVVMYLILTILLTAISGTLTRG